MVSSIANSLGFGSGIDIVGLINDLSDASRTPKIQALNAQVKSVQTKISALAQVKSDMTSFASSLKDVLTNGSVLSQPQVSDDSVLSAIAAQGTRLGNFSAGIEISQLARGQSVYSNHIASTTEAVGQGSLVLAVDGIEHSIVIDGANDTLEGLASAINATGSGVQANVVRDASGFMLVLKGETGQSKSFTLTSQSGADPLLERFTFGGVASQMILGNAAQDALFSIDGVPYSRASNSFSDVVPGITFSFKKLTNGIPVQVGTKRPLETLKTTLDDFVSVFNQMKGDIKTARTATNGDQSLRALDQKLLSFLSQPLTSHPEINSLSDIGIKTNRDGTIAIDRQRLEAAIKADPDAVEAIFSPARDATHTISTDPGLSEAFQALSDGLTASGGALESLNSRLARESESLDDKRERIEAREERYKDRLTRQFGQMDTRLAALKATQSYLDQQVKIWTQSGSN